MIGHDEDGGENIGVKEQVGVVGERVERRPVREEQQKRHPAPRHSAWKRAAVMGKATGWPAWHWDAMGRWEKVTGMEKEMEKWWIVVEWWMWWVLLAKENAVPDANEPQKKWGECELVHLEPWVEWWKWLEWMEEVEQWWKWAQKAKNRVKVVKQARSW